MTDPFGGLPPPPAPPRKRPFLPVTYALLAVLTLVFLAEAAVGHDLSVESDVALMRMGALYLPAVRDGDFWRIGSYAFLHIGWLHILMNGWSMWILLPQLEMAFGSNLALGFFCATAMAGGAASVGWVTLHGGDPHLIAGASGGIFGLFGATLAFYYRIRDRFTPEARRALTRSMLFNLLINVGIAFSFPVDNAAHLGGLASGVVLGLLAPQRSLPRAFWHKPAQWLIVGSVLVLASMEGAAFARSVKPKPRTLRGPGVEAKMDGLFVPLGEPGRALIPGVASLRIGLENAPIAASQDVRRLGGRSWVAQTGKAGDEDVLTLVTDDGENRLRIKLQCADPICRGDNGDKLLELTARTLRASP